MGVGAGRVGEIEQVYRSRLPELWRVAAAISGSREAAPDLVQEAFVRAVRQVDSFRGDGPLEGWLWRIVVNVARNERREPPTSVLPEELPAASASALGDTQPQLVAAMSQLSERQRLVLFLRYYADLDYRTIAEALAVSSGTVGATLTTARAALAQALGVEEATR
ncbi:MAG TPA: sigma-70 family RNA polymerase sigma factor [Solirubrobacteraceae bacterium]|jgi:RNA polymerase sigma-70 factor (ECF subfamily)|nr:sigma-70 family RNA polymerase sigma factor [Solirubrobacteraceae bacterium]